MTTPASEHDGESSASLITSIAPYLVFIAEILKPDWDHDVLADAILAAATANWTPVRLLREYVRLVAGEDGSPWDLKRAAANPFERDPEAAVPSVRPRNPEYAAFRERLDAMPPLPEHRSQRRDGAA